MEAYFHLGKPAILKISDGRYESMVVSDIPVEMALNTPLDENRIKQQLTKLGNTPFVCTNIQIFKDEGITFPISKLNELRRNICEIFEEKRKEKLILNKVTDEYSSKEIEITNFIHVNVMNEEQYHVVKEYPVEIYISDRNLYEKIKNDHVHYNYPRVCDNYDIEGRIHDIGGIHKGSITSPYMNTMNIYSANVLFNEGIKCVSLSYECNDFEIQELVKEYEQVFKKKGNFELEVYGRVENMILENCIIKSQYKTKKHCNLCHMNRFTIKDMKNKSYILKGDENCRMKVYHSETFNKIENVKEYQKMGITNFALSFTFEGKEEVHKIMNSFMKMM